MNTLRCLVVDDEPLATKLIAAYVDRTPFMTLVGEAHNAEEAMDILQKTDVDLMFLDIRMPRMSGMELARIVPDNVRIVFTTAYADHAVEGFRVNALDYLLKPVSYDEFLVSANRALKAAGNIPAATPRPQGTDHLLVKSEYRLLRIPTDDILYIEGLKDYIKIVFDSPEKPVLSLMSMKSLEDTLPEGRFMRVHRSFIVNTDKVRLIERNSIIMGGRSIPVSDTYRRSFMTLIGGTD